ncbi:Valyl-tRNA synthetase [Carabus blaptoides fortunei]
MMRFSGKNYEHYTCTILKNYLRLKQQKHLFLSSQSKTKEFAAAYVPSAVEAGKYEEWIKDTTDSLHDAKPFSMIIPPPNITGTLHLGHALTLAIQDVLVRWNKMRAIQTLWIPGMDHAGIATQVVVEKKLWREQKKTRHDIGRAKFEQEIWKWKEAKSEVIRQQVKQLGALPDWSREYFTMDETQSSAVTEAFIRLFDSGLIYRSDYLVNWSCVLQSAISDIEVEHLEVQARTEMPVPGYEQPVQFGALTKFAYKLCEMDGELVVSTTRPETILGDVAIAVHPTDERYETLRGKHVLHPFRQEPIPIICDEFVDPAFGTGAVKVTPAHDPVDFEVGKRHGLATVPVIDERGDIMHAAGTFAGMKRFHARRVITERLETLGLLRAVEDHPMTVPVCSRSGDVVEYLIKPQWFVDCTRMAYKAAQDVKEGRLTIEPAMFEKVWFNWLENIRDWCVSRQLWWGHRVPAYQCHMKQSPDEPKVWVAADNLGSAQEKASVKLSTAPENVVAVQDEDVLDTWFSSSLLPFALFGWPDKTTDLGRFYPLTLMETGHDILFFWVARMVMLGSELTGCLPFNKILLHGVVCDANGRKMSKSLGNVISPEDVISGITLKGLERQARYTHATGLLSTAELERAVSGQNKMFPTGIPECGADALRFTLCSHNIKSHFINFDVSECYTNKLFCNKIWQACKFTRISAQKVVAGSQSLSPLTYEVLSVMDRWILSRLSWMVADVNEALRRNDFHVATSALKQFLYSELCDVYVETTKPGLRYPAGRVAVGHVSTLVRCLDIGLRCIAPFMPHLAEELLLHLPDHPEVTKYKTVMSAPYPQSLVWRDLQLEADVQIALDTVIVIRRLRQLYNITTKYKPKAHITSTSPAFVNLTHIIAVLSGCYEVTVAPELGQVAGTTVSDTVGNHGTVHLIVPTSAVARMDDDRARLLKKIDKLLGDVDKLQKTINADGFKTKAPQKVQDAHAKKLASLEEELDRLQRLQQS